MTRRSALAIGFCLLSLLNLGCAVDYLIGVGLGELNVLLNSRPITEVLDSNTLDATTAAELKYVLDARAYAVDVLGLYGGNSYTTFYDSEGQAVLYNISACRQDRLEPYIWSFPFVGEVEYIGYFDEAQADRCADNLRACGYDVFKYAPRGYSTLGWFADPVFSDALTNDAIALAEVVIHELAHNTIYQASNTVFNESVATFVGRTGTLEFLIARMGSDHEAIKIAREEWEDTDVYNQYWAEVYQTLETFYARQDLTSEQKVAQREQVFADLKAKYLTDYLPRFHNQTGYAGVADLPMDNARVMIMRRYNLDLDLFQSVYDKLGKNLPAAIQIFAQSTGAADPKQYLRDWLASLQLAG